MPVLQLLQDAVERQHAIDSPDVSSLCSTTGAVTIFNPAAVIAPHIRLIAFSPSLPCYLAYSSPSTN